VVDLAVADYQRCVELIERYADLGLGLVDTSVVTVAQNHQITTVATLNDRDFRVVRPATARPSSWSPDRPGTPAPRPTPGFLLSPPSCPKASPRGDRHTVPGAWNTGDG
jgi:hypothetical protein